jgi:Uma2 family endonuclease
MNISHRQPAGFTNAEFERLVRSGGFGAARVELRRGLIAKMNPQHVKHARAKRLVANAIDAALRAAASNWIVDQETSVDFSEGFSPLPDIVVWDPSSVPPDFDGPIPAAAVRLIVEVADTTLADDLGEKLDDYAAAGLVEYWVVDVRGRQVLLHAMPANGRFADRVAIPFGTALVSRAYAALRLDTTGFS